MAAQPLDETYIDMKGEWQDLYRAVASEGNTLAFMLSAKRDGKAATRFFRKVLGAQHTQAPRVITVAKNAAYPTASKGKVSELSTQSLILNNLENFLSKFNERIRFSAENVE